MSRFAGCIAGIVTAAVLFAPIDGRAQDNPSGSGDAPAGESQGQPTTPLPPTPRPPPEPSTADADEKSDAGSFAAGKVRISGSGGMVNAFDARYFALRLAGGYFVLDGFEVGADVEQWFGSGPLVTKLSPQIRYVVYQVPYIHPYVGALYRHWFIGDEIDDVDSVGGRAGAFYSGSTLVLGGGVVVEQAVTGCTGDCLFINPEIILSVSF